MYNACHIYIYIQYWYHMRVRITLSLKWPQSQIVWELFRYSLNACCSSCMTTGSSAFPNLCVRLVLWSIFEVSLQSTHMNVFVSSSISCAWHCLCSMYICGWSQHIAELIVTSPIFYELPLCFTGCIHRLCILIYCVYICTLAFIQQSAPHSCVALRGIKKLNNDPCVWVIS